MKTPPRTFTAPIVAGAIRPQDRTAIAAYVKATFADGEEVDVTVGPHEVPHTDRQRAYWFAVIVPYAQHGFADAGTRLSKDDAHDFLCWHLMPDERRTIRWGQHEAVMRASFSAASKERVTRLIDEAIQFIAENFFIACPDPSEYQRDTKR